MTQQQLTTILYLIGKPGVGKYSIAREMIPNGYKLCDNHLINNPIFSLLPQEHSSVIPKFAWEAMGGIRDNVLKFLSVQKQGNYILTNALYETATDHEIFKKVEQMACDRQSLFIPIKLFLSESEHIKRIQNPHRKMMFKTTDSRFVNHSEPTIQIKHSHLLNLDLTRLKACDAANLILNHVKTCHDISNI